MQNLDYLEQSTVNNSLEELCAEFKEFSIGYKEYMEETVIPDDVRKDAISLLATIYGYYGQLFHAVDVPLGELPHRKKFYFDMTAIFNNAKAAAGSIVARVDAYNKEACCETDEKTCYDEDEIDLTESVAPFNPDVNGCMTGEL